MDDYKFILVNSVTFEMVATASNHENWGQADWLMVTSHLKWPIHDQIVSVVSSGSPYKEAPKEVVKAITSAFGTKPFKCTVSFQTTLPLDPCSRTEFHISLHSSADIRQLNRILGSDVRIQAQLGDLQWVKNIQELEKSVNGVDFKTAEMAIMSPWGTGRKMICEDVAYNDDLNENFRKRPAGYRSLVGSITIYLISKTKGRVTPTDVFKRMLEKGILSDVLIVTRDCAEVKCHRNILAAYSETLRTEFEKEERQREKIHMVEMTEKGLNALLAYFYYGDLSKAEESCAVVLEMLEVGQKYKMPLLEREIRNMLVSKPESWFQLDETLKMFLFVHVHKLDHEWEEVKKKLVTALKLYPETLTTSSTYKEIRNKNPDFPEILLQCSLSLSK